MPDELLIRYEFPVFPDQQEPRGHLTEDVRSHACWYFFVLAEKQRCLVGKSIDDQFGILDGNLWMDTQYVQTARTVATIYGLKDPSEFMQFWPMVTAEALRLGMDPPRDEYMRPLRILT